MSRPSLHSHLRAASSASAALSASSASAALFALVALAWRATSGNRCRAAFAAVVLGIAWAAVALAARAASAQTPPAYVVELLRKGAAASAGGQYQACVDSYSAALAITHEHTTAAELGLCEEALGRFVEAHDHLLYALEGEVPNAIAGSRGAWKRYRAALERVSDRVARVIVFVRPNEAEVFLDGGSLGKRVSGRYFAVTPGEHTWSAQLEGYSPEQITHTVRAGDLPDITFALRERAPDRAAPPSPSAAGRAGPEPVCNLSCIERIRQKPKSELQPGYRKRMDPTLALVAGGLMSAGFTADVGPGFWIGGEARWGAPEEVGFSLGAEVRALLPTKAAITRQGETLDLSAVELGASPCLRYKWALGCAIVDLGVTIPGRIPASRFDDSVPVIAMFGFGPRLAADIEIVEHVAVRAFADLRFSPLTYLGYDLGETPIWDVPLVCGIFGLGFSFK